jgi:hypothetical protein
VIYGRSEEDAVEHSITKREILGETLYEFERAVACASEGSEGVDPD